MAKEDDSKPSDDNIVPFPESGDPPDSQDSEQQQRPPAADEYGLLHKGTQALFDRYLELREKVSPREQGSEELQEMVAIAVELQRRGVREQLEDAIRRSKFDLLDGGLAGGSLDDEDSTDED